MDTTTIYYAMNEDALKNGSYYRFDRATSKKAHRYILGDYQGTVAVDFPTLENIKKYGWKKFSPSQAKHLLPLFCK